MSKRIHAFTHSRISCFIATVGGLGYLPWAPGTWGSLVGALLGLAAVRGLGWLLSIGLLIIAFAVCAFICARAERALDQHDPAAVILDEVWGMAALVAATPWATSWAALLTGLFLFRAFDIVKPPPLRWLARLPGGVGIMADDLGASLYGVGLLWVLRWWTGWPAQ